jgi:hypothetical protein
MVFSVWFIRGWLKIARPMTIFARELMRIYIRAGIVENG